MNSPKIPVYADKNKEVLVKEIDILKLSPLALKALQNLNVAYAYVDPEDEHKKIGVTTEGKEFRFPLY